MGEGASRTWREKRLAWFGMPLEVKVGMSTIATSPNCDYVPPPSGAFRIAPRFSAARQWRRALSAFSRSTPVELGSVSSFEAACIVPDDPGEVVRGAKPISAGDRERMREQHISRLMADYRRQTAN